jgi:hypothetical protein
MKRYANLQALCERDLEQERANSQCVPHHSAVYTSSFVNKTWCTNCTVYTRADEPTARVPKKAFGKISLESGIHCCPNFVLFILPYQRLYIVKNMCINTHIWRRRDYMNYRCCQITLQGNIFTQIGAVRSVDWIFIVGAPVRRWPDQYVTLGRTFYCLIL